MNDVSPARVVEFVWYLRRAGFSLTQSHSLDSLEILQVLKESEVEPLRRGLKTVLTSTCEEWQQFDHHFYAYFLDDLQVKEAGVGRASPFGLEDAQSMGSMHRQGVSYSPADDAGLRKVENMTAEDFSQLRLLLRRRLMPSAMKARREIAGRLDSIVDVRRSLRDARYGELIPPTLLGRRRPVPQFVVLADVSGSMQRFLKPQLGLLWLLLQLYPNRCEVFAFSTGIWRVTPLLRTRDIATVEKAWMALFAAGIPSGTRIGDALHTFHRNWGRKQRLANCHLLILSDGIDRGDPKLISKALGRLAMRFRGIFWLHPHAGESGFLPETTALRAAQAHIQAVLPLTTISDMRHALEVLERAFSGIGASEYSHV